MASPKSDEELQAEAAQKRADSAPVERPGVYVQVVGTPRRRKSSSNNVRTQDSGGHMVDDTARPRSDSQVRRGPGPMGMGGGSAERAEAGARAPSEARERERVPSEPYAAPVAASPASPAAHSSPTRPNISPTRPNIVEIQQPLNDPRAESENTNHRADIVRVSAPPPRYSSTPSAADRLSAPSVLDAKPSLRTDPPAPARTPWALIAGVAIMSAIIAAAGVVALQEWQKKQEPAISVSAPAAAPIPVQVPAPPPAPVVAAPVPAPAPEPTPAVEPAPAAAAPDPAPVAAPAPIPPVADPEPAPVTDAKKVTAGAAPKAGTPKPAAAAPTKAAVPSDNVVPAEPEPDAIPRNPYPAHTAAPSATPTVAR